MKATGAADIGAIVKDLCARVGGHETILRRVAEEERLTVEDSAK